MPWNRTSTSPALELPAELGVAVVRWRPDSESQLDGGWCEAFDEGQRIGYRFKARGSLRHAPTRRPLHISSGDPGGIRTRDLDLERVASWARLDDGVSERQYTRPMVERGGSDAAARSSRPSPLPPASWPRGSRARRACAGRAPRTTSRPR